MNEHARDSQPARPRALVVVGLLSVFAVLGGAWWVGDEAAAVDPESTVGAVRSGRLSWRAEDRRAYRLELDSTVVLDPEVPGRTVGYAMRGRLGMRVAGVDGDDAEVAFQLSDVDYRVDGRRDDARCRALAVPFVARFDGAMPKRFRFPPGLDGEVRDQLAELVRTFQATRPIDARSTWSAVEEHQGGRYRAAYSTGGDGAWHKRRIAYLQGAAVTQGGDVPGVADARVLRSEGRLAPSPSASWWEDATLLDELVLSNDGRAVARVTTRTTLVAAAEAWDQGSELARVVRIERLLEQPVPALDRRPEDSSEPELETGPPTAADRARFHELVTAFTMGRGDELACVHQLAALLKRVPALAAEIPPLLRDAALLATVAAGLAHALELAGNRACQVALGDVCVDPRYPNGNRLRAIVALGGVARPTDESVALLTALCDPAGTDLGAQDLGNAALLALGNLGRSLRTAGATSYADLAGRLLRSVDEVGDPNTRSAALAAIGNARDPALAPTAIAALDAASAPVRAAAARALAALDEPAGFRELSARLRTETDGRVRAAMVGSMREMRERSDAAFATCAELVEREPDPAARGAMARYLVDNLDRYPAGRGVLERIVRDETDPGTLSYVAGRLHRARGRSR